MTRELNRATLAVLIAFAAIALSAAFWTIVQADSLLARDDNARNVIAEQRIRRGAIVDRDGEPLATSQEMPSGVMRRVYPHPDAAGAVGYYSLTYGTAGIEAAFDRALRGADRRDAWAEWVDDLLHRPQQGSDVRATIDLDVQRAAAAALAGRAGAAVVVEVPSGRVLAMVSQPGYDPNRLDQDWDALTRDEQTSPLLNRAVAGLYQPGGALQTAILSAILAAQPDLQMTAPYVLSSQIPDAREPVQAGGLTLTCLDGAPAGPLTLAQAYAFGCPALFAAVTDGPVPADRLWERWQVLGLLEPPALAGFETVAGPSPEPLSADMPPEQLRAALVGQGSLTITPLQMVQVIAAVANGGTAVPLHMVDAVRPPGGSAWQPVDLPSHRPALLREDVAAALRLALSQAAAEAPFLRAAQPAGLNLFGHGARAYAGPAATPYVWFVGFVDQPAGGTSVAAVVVVEDEADPGVAARVAGVAFAAVDGDAE